MVLLYDEFLDTQLSSWMKGYPLSAVRDCLQIVKVFSTAHNLMMLQAEANKNPLNKVLQATLQ